MDIHSLPDEVLALIFEKLPTATLCLACPAVCRRWQLVLREYVNAQLDFAFARPRRWDDTEKLSGQALQTLMRRFHSVSSISFASVLRGGCQGVHGGMVTGMHLSPVFHQLTRINLSGCCPVDDAWLLGALSGDHPLRFLTHLSLANTSVTANALAALFGCLPREGCPLEDLDLSGLAVNDELLAHHLGRKCLVLQYLRLNGCPLVSSAGLTEVIKGCPQLLGLHICDCPAVDSAAATALASHCSGLKTLRFKGTALLGFCMEAIGHIFASGLEDVAMSGDAMGSGTRLFGTHGGEYLFERYPTLKTIDAENVRCAFPRPLSTHLAVSTSRLSKLVVHCCDFEDAFLLILARTCPLLRHGSFTVQSGSLSDAGLVALARGCPALEFIEVVSLHIAVQASATDEFPLALAKHCPSLRALRIAFPVGFTSIAMLALALSCPNLGDVRIAQTDALSTTCDEMKHVAWLARNRSNALRLLQ